METNIDANHSISDVKEYLSLSKHLVNGPVYEGICKQSAEGCFKNGMELDGVYFLSESHAATLRNECLYINNMKPFCELKEAKTPVGLNAKYVSFDSEYSNNAYNGLVKRLKEMPKEWVFVQLTRPYDPTERWVARPAKSVTSRSKLHIVRYHCGENFMEPFHTLIPEPRGTSDTTESIFQLLYDATMDKTLHNSVLPLREISKKRHRNNQHIKAVVNELMSGWLREWACLFLGHISSKEVDSLIKEPINKIFKQYTSKTKIQTKSRHIVHLIANGCAHLSVEEIKKAVSQIISDTQLRKKIIEEIIKIKDNNPSIAITKRNPVILIIDDKLSCVPWEMLPILARHPVIRTPSIHFSHALFKEHQSSIVNGNKILTDEELQGFYLINPDQSLGKTEQLMIDFLEKRLPNWKGITGREPTREEILDALKNYGIFFPFILGMLWSVTSTDTDVVALALLNNWLPGQPLSLEEFSINSCSLGKMEPELLCGFKVARQSAALYSNSAALIAYGIPVSIE